MSQSSNATTNLQLHHNFRWVLCANHMEPVKGFLGRYLRRKLVASEVKANTLNNDLGKVMATDQPSLRSLLELSPHL